MTVKNILQAIRKSFSEAGIETSALDARILVCRALDISHEKLLLSDDRPVSQEDLAKINDFVKQRLAGKPVAKIIGIKEFYGRDFITTTNTLDPRPDSEILIETVLNSEFRTKEDIKILDLGTGTGCLVLTLLAEMPKARAIAVDQSLTALEVAKKNAWQIGVEDRIVFAQSDWFSDVLGSFDVIISNPPYIPESDIAGLAKEVRLYDPLSALVGGADGLDPYRIIIPQLDKFLKPDGMIVFELGLGQAELVAAMLNEAGFAKVFVNPDLAGISRVVGGFKLQKPMDSVR